MGTPRILFDADDLVISKPGKDATNASLPDTDKIFDSKWLFGIQVLGSGVWTYPITTTPYIDFTLPDYGFRPALMIRTKVRPFYNTTTTYEYAQGPDRPNTLAFCQPQDRGYDRSDLNNDFDRFLNDTTVRIYRADLDSIVEFHWTAIAL